MKCIFSVANRTLPLSLFIIFSYDVVYLGNTYLPTFYNSLMALSFERKLRRFHPWEEKTIILIL